MSKLDIKLKVMRRDKKGRDLVPEYATAGSSGVDLRAAITEALTLAPGSTHLVPTGIAVHIGNDKLTGLIVPRSGLGHKHGIVLANLTGVIDSDYQGEIFVPLWNRGSKVYTVQPCDRIAQMIFVPVVQVAFQRVNEFEGSARGDGGFGSTGKK